MGPGTRGPVRLGRSALLALVCLALAVPVVTSAEPENTKGFRKGVTLAGVREHQAAFQTFADAHNGIRVSGTAGFDASAQYVVDRATAAGYVVSVQEFTFNFSGDNTPPVLQQVSPTARTYVDGVDFATMTGSGNGDTTASVVAVDLIVPSPAANTSTSGCEAADFAGFPAGSIALLQRGTCAFADKALNAAAAGATGAIIFNEGNPGRTAFIQGTLGTATPGIPVVGASFALGDEFRNGALNGPTGVTARLRTDLIIETRTTRNVIAETPGGDPANVIVVGAHLDSVTRGPGINDNGSGSAAILEVAETYAAQGRAPRNKIRFMWYGAEEFGLIGSTHYVNSLSAAELGRIRLMLNFDMVGSPNFVRFVYDGDNSKFAVGTGVQDGPAGSGAIEQVFADYFAGEGLLAESTPFSGRSDYGPFITNGIPAGGLFTGAEGQKTAAEAAAYGGTEGQQYDPCYHLACDTFANNSNVALDTNADAIAHAVLVFAKRNFALSPLVDPAVADPIGIDDAGATSGGGGGLHEDHEERVSS